MVDQNEVKEKLAQQVADSIQGAENAYDQLAEAWRSWLSDTPHEHTATQLQIIGAGRTEFVHEYRTLTWATAAQFDTHAVAGDAATRLRKGLWEIRDVRRSIEKLPDAMALPVPPGDAATRAAAELTNDAIRHANASNKEWRRFVTKDLRTSIGPLCLFYAIELMLFIVAVTVISEGVEALFGDSGWLITVGGVSAGVVLAWLAEKWLRRRLRGFTRNFTVAAHTQINRNNLALLHLRLAYLEEAGRRTPSG